MKHPVARAAALPAAVLALVMLVAACSTASPTPATASHAPASPAAASPSVAPSEPGAAGEPAIRVALANATGSRATIDVVAPAGVVRGAESGVPGDGASVEPYQLVVANDDPSTLRLTWIGGPCDAASTLTVDPENRQLMLVQPACPGDAVAFDRVLIVRFADPIVAGTLTAIVQDGTDSSD